MADSPITDLESAHRPIRRRIRLVVLALLVTAAIAAAAWAFGTEGGRHLLHRENLRQLGLTAQAWVAANPLKFYSLFVLVYVVCGVLLLPVWWLQTLAGFAMGLWPGLFWATSASVVTAVATATISRWLGEEWVRQRILGHGKAAARAERFIATVDRNGLLVVLLGRLCYFVPYGVSNYLFGLLGLPRRDIALGTMVGGAPVYIGWVAAGARPGWVVHWQFWAAIVGMNALLLGPLLLHAFRVRARRKSVEDAGVPASNLAAAT